MPITTADQKYPKFQWRGILYKYVCFPNGLAICLRKFTTLLKPVYSLGWGTFQQVMLMTHISRVVTMMTVKEMLGILSNYLIPLGLLYTLKNHPLFQHWITFMGFIIDSITMTVYPTSEKIKKVIHTCQGLCLHPSVREVEFTLGLLKSNFPTAKLGPLHFR